jgi:integrase
MPEVGKTRHTFATVALMRRVSPQYVAAQLGHSVKMLLEKYARWIPGNDGRAERRLLEDAMGKSSPEVPQPPTSDHLSEEKNGRRDWTRTNDPHHVKVVL